MVNGGEEIELARKKTNEILTVYSRKMRIQIHYRQNNKLDKADLFGWRDRNLDDRVCQSTKGV